MTIFGDSLPVIYVVTMTREELIADGDLHNVSPLAREAGIRFPVALTRALWEDVSAIPAAYSHEDETGRLWDVLNMFRFAALRFPGCNELVYHLILHTEGNEAQEGVYLVKAVCAPGDNAEPVITLMKPEED